MGFGMNFNSMGTTLGDQFKKYLQRQQDEQQRLAAARINGDYGQAVTAPHEHRGGQPTDRTDTVTDVAAAVKNLARADKDRSLMTAISKLHQRRQSNGKPLVYVPE